MAGRCGVRSPVALRGRFRRQLGSSPAAYRAAYRARRPQAERGQDDGTAQSAPTGVPAGRPEPAGQHHVHQLHPDGAVPHQSRRTAAAGALGSSLTASAPGVPGQRSAP